MTDERVAVRQGDVLLVPIAKSPSGLERVAPENDRLIVARGEVTGHHHSFSVYDRVSLFMDTGSNGLFVLAQTPVKLEQLGADNKWEEGMHTPLEIQPGAYEVRIQRSVSQAGRVRFVED